MNAVIRATMLVGLSPFAADPLPYFTGDIASLQIANGVALTAADVVNLAGTSAGIPLSALPTGTTGTTGPTGTTGTTSAAGCCTADTCTALSASAPVTNSYYLSTALASSSGKLTDTVGGLPLSYYAAPSISGVSSTGTLGSLGSLMFDGSSSYANFINDATVQQTTGPTISVAMWVQPNPTAAGLLGGHLFDFSTMSVTYGPPFQGASTATGDNIALRIQASPRDKTASLFVPMGILAANSPPSSPLDISAVASVALNQWSHVVMTVAAAGANGNAVTLFVNGVQGTDPAYPHRRSRKCVAQER